MCEEQGRDIIRKICEDIDYIQCNWQDSIGKSYIIHLRGMEQRLQSLEMERERIREFCNRILNEADDDCKVRIRAR